MRYFLHLSYLGTNYSGWQRQKNAISIQRVIEDSISSVLKEKTFIHGCGRTDAGVHASQYFAHIDIDKIIGFDFIERINHVLPHDIYINNLIPVDDTCNAQYDAIERTYTYLLHTQKDPFKIYTSAYYKVHNLDLKKILTALEIIKQTRDFRSLCKNPDLYKHTLCDIHSIEFIQSDDFNYKFIIKANRFLRGMIRYMVARLIDIGTDKLSIEEFSTTLAAKNDFGFKHSKQGYPQGLYLSKIKYPYPLKDSK